MTLSLSCRCGKVVLAATARPILAASCHCGSCRTAGGQLERLVGAPPLLNRDGGTDYLLYRKDRVTCVSGQSELTEHRLRPGSPTRRVVASCCNSAMFLDFTRGHWLSLYRDRCTTEPPEIALRLMTGGKPLADDLPNYPGLPAGAMIKLIGAWIAMGLRRPEITWGKSTN